MPHIYSAPWGTPPKEYDSSVKDQPIAVREFSDIVILIQADVDTHHYICVEYGKQLAALIKCLTTLQKQHKEK